MGGTYEQSEEAAVLVLVRTAVVCILCLSRVFLLLLHSPLHSIEMEARANDTRKEVLERKKRSLALKPHLGYETKIVFKTDFDPKLPVL